MQLPEGFEAQLVAGEPTIINPLQINFDARGRLYVLCAPRYPQILPGQAPSDYPDFAAFLVERGIDSVSLTADAVVRTTLRILEVEAAAAR